MAFDPVEQLQSAKSRHFEIEDDDFRERMLFAIGKGAVSLKIINRVQAVSNPMDRIINMVFFESALEEEEVSWIIFDDENGKGLLHRLYHSQFGKTKQPRSMNQERPSKHPWQLLDAESCGANCCRTTEIEIRL